MENRISVIGLGYVGLPLAIEFSKQYKVVGFDIDKSRVKQLKDQDDKTGEIDISTLNKVMMSKDNFLSNHSGLFLSSNQKDIIDSNIYIITVPTPIDSNNSPDLSHLLSATEMVAGFLKRGDIVIYESTVYPGCTEENCVPILQKLSGLVYNESFFCGYSPERISPGDRINTLTKIKKITSGSTDEVAIKIDVLYNSIIEAGTHMASSIKVAEASKAIENAQRDLNISFVNELAFIFDKMNIDTHEVLEAAKTKWNFLPFYPGLVGGHCISVDPYYLAYKAKKLGYNPEVILSGRNVNNKMGQFIASKVLRLMSTKGLNIEGANILILGVTFKEDCPDIRNTKIIDVYNELVSFGAQVDVFDSVANKEQVKRDLDINLISDYTIKQYSAIILAVAHTDFKSINFKKIKSDRTVIFDVKSFIPLNFIDGRL